jgi:LysR family transcriptional regulator, cyn operon transcriptional activator
MTDLLLIRSFLVVAEHGNVTDAARILGISQSALSRRLAQLEEWVGCPLIARSRRGVVMTEAGEVVAREGVGLVQRLDRIREEVQARQRLELGVVRIGGGASAVGFLVPEAIAAFQRRFPRVVFQLKEAGSRDVEAAVSSDELELGIVTLPVRGRGLYVTPLCRDRLVLVAGKAHPLTSKRRPAARDLSGLALVGFEGGSAIRQLIDGALRAVGVEMNVVMELRSVAAILQMVETTHSLGFVSELAVGSLSTAHRGAVRVLQVSGLTIERQLALISQEGRELSPAAAKFSELLLEVASNQPALRGRRRAKDPEA